MRTSNLTLIILSVALAIAASSCGGKSIRKQVKAEMSKSSDIEVVAPDRAKLVFENEFIKTVVIELKPGVNLPGHPGPDRLVYALTDCNLEFTDESGEKQTYNWRKGQAAWLAAGEHSAVNTSERTARFLVVNRITSGLPGLKEADSGMSLPEVAPNIAARVFDNHAMQIAEVKLPPKTASPVFEGVNSLLYSLNLSTLKQGQVTGPDSTAKVLYEQATIQPGTAKWRERGRQIVENPGDVEANFLVFSFKE